MNSPPLNPKPRSAVPSYLLNGGSPLNQPPTSSRAQERENLASSIKSTYGRRTLVDLDTEMGSSSTAHSASWIGLGDANKSEARKHTSLNEPPRDIRDEAPITPPATVSRPASPYTLNPTIDFDGLSWPSKYLQKRLSNSV